MRRRTRRPRSRASGPLSAPSPSEFVTPPSRNQQQTCLRRLGPDGKEKTLMSLRAALDLATVGAASSAAFIAYQGGWVPFTSASFLTWLIPSAIGGAIAGGLAAPL